MRATLLLALAALMLAGCGRKPGFVDAPPGSDPAAYPRTYPDPRTDPAPTGVNPL